MKKRWLQRENDELMAHIRKIENAHRCPDWGDDECDWPGHQPPLTLARFTPPTWKIRVKKFWKYTVLRRPRPLTMAELMGPAMEDMKKELARQVYAENPIMAHLAKTKDDKD